MKKEPGVVGLPTIVHSKKEFQQMTIMLMLGETITAGI